MTDTVVIEVTDEVLKAEMVRDEGRKPLLYMDTMGNRTCGIGHNMDSHPLPAGVEFPLDDGEIELLYEEDMGRAMADLDQQYFWWRDMSYVRQRVLANMSFNMGLHVLEEFVNTMAAMEQGRYADAAAGMMKSTWAGQVGNRAVRLAAMMKAG